MLTGCPFASSCRKYVAPTFVNPELAGVSTVSAAEVKSDGAGKGSSSKTQMGSAAAAYASMLDSPSSAAGAGAGAKSAGSSSGSSSGDERGATGVRIQSAASPASASSPSDNASGGKQLSAAESAAAELALRRELASLVGGTTGHAGDDALHGTIPLGLRLLPR